MDLAMDLEIISRVTALTVSLDSHKDDDSSQ